MARYTAVIVAAIGTFVSAQGQRDSASLLTTGAFHGDEVHARTGEQWLGLFQAPSGFVWRVVALTTRRVNDPVVDEPNEKTGIEVRVPGGEPVLLTKSIAGLLGARVRTVLHSPEGLSLPEKDALELDLDAAYRLRVVDRRLSDEAPEKRSRLVLESHGISQVLYEWPSGLLDQHCELVWAGDLDGDGKLDLLMILSDHYNVMERTLFLSSRRSKADFVKRIAAFVTVGC
jgi:hypothetical protein